MRRLAPEIDTTSLASTPVQRLQALVGSSPRVNQLMGMGGSVMNGIGGLSGGSFDPLSMLKGIGGSVMNGIGGLFGGSPNPNSLWSNLLGPSTPTPPEATSPEPPSADNDPPSRGFLPLSALSLLRKGLSFF